MSNNTNQAASELESEDEEEIVPQTETLKPKAKPVKNITVRDHELPPTTINQHQVSQQQPEYQTRPEQHQIAERAEGYRTSAIRESRIKDRPLGTPAEKSALKIKIELDLEVEVDLYARVKGDITIGLM